MSIKYRLSFLNKYLIFNKILLTFFIYKIDHFYFNENRFLFTSLLKIVEIKIIIYKEIYVVCLI